MIPCSIASTEHGTYSIITESEDVSKTKTQPLNTFDEVQNGETVQFTCDDGFSVQGPTKLKCMEGSWDVSGLPECVPSPCSLPAIDHAAYQVSCNGATIVNML